MNFNPMRIITFGTVAMLCPVILFAQAEPGSLPEVMAQAGNPSGQPQPVPGQQTQMPSMQDSSGNNGQTPQMMKDKMFIRQVVAGGIAEIQFGQLAAQKAEGDDVKAFGQKMVDDHTALNKDMEPVADSVGVRLPKRMNKSDQAELKKLQGLSGNDFDTEYVTVMVKNHHQDLRQFRLEAANTQDPTLRDAVVKGERVIHEHLVMVDKLAKSKGIEVPHHYGNHPHPAPAPTQ